MYIINPDKCRVTSAAEICNHLVWERMQTAFSLLLGNTWEIIKNESIGLGMDGLAQTASTVAVHHFWAYPSVRTIRQSAYSDSCIKWPYSAHPARPTFT